MTLNTTLLMVRKHLFDILGQLDYEDIDDEEIRGHVRIIADVLDIDLTKREESD